MDWHEAVDLEKLSKLAETNPEGFEKKVQAIIAKTVSNCSEESREIQLRINRAENFNIVNLPKDPKEFEIERRKLIDKLLEEAEGDKTFSLVDKLQKRIDDGLDKALFNLGRLQELAEKDLDLFEKEKEALVLRRILSLSKEKRYKSKQFQWKIDAICKTGKNRLDRLVKFQTLFYDGVYGEGGFVDLLKSFGPANQRFQQSAVKVVVEKNKQKRRAYLKVVK